MEKLFALNGICRKHEITVVQTKELEDVKYPLSWESLSSNW